MSEERKHLQEALRRYTSETLTSIHTVRGFCETSSEWMSRRKKELQMMRDIKDRADKWNLSISCITQLEDKGKTFMEYMKNKMTLTSADRRRAELQKELADVLKDTLDGLEELHCFLDAVEMLAVTSLHVFTENKVLGLPEDISLVQGVIRTAGLICPQLLEFKRDANLFFLPKLHNVEVLAYQLDKYIQTSKIICERMEKSCFGDVSQKTPEETVVELTVDLSEEDVQKTLDHINQLDRIRRDSHFRMAFMFQQNKAQHFDNEFSERQPRMLQFLADLEETAVQLDRMNTWAKISSVAGSSVVIMGGVLYIVGLVLIPFTAGASRVLTMTGIGLGVTSVVTTATEIGINVIQQKKASEVFQSFMEDMQSLQDCVDDVTSQTVSELKHWEEEVALGVGKVFCEAIGLLNKSPVSEFIRARAALWSSEMDSWEKIRDSLQEGLPTSEKKEAMLRDRVIWRRRMRDNRQISLRK